MSNLHATLGITLRYTNEEGGASAMTPIAISCAYKAQNHGAIDVGTGDTGELSIPFGAVDVGATCVVIENKTGQDVEVKVNGTASDFNLPTGGSMVFGGPLAAAAEPILSMSVTLAGTQSGDGTVAYHVFGDAT